MTKAKLPQEIKDYLEAAWSPSEDSKLLNLIIIGIKSCGYDAAGTLSLLSNKGEVPDSAKSAILALFPTQSVRSFKDLLLDPSTEIFQNVHQNNECFIIAPSQHYITKLEASTVKDILKHPRGTFENRRKLATIDYNPHRGQYSYPDQDGYPVLNLYNPPHWKKKSYFDPTASIEVVSSMPEVYSLFFSHLFPSLDSQKYVLDWIAFSLKEKNIPILSIVGTNRGIGKGILGEIIAALHGKENSEVCKQLILTKEFNSQMFGKTFIYMDEVTIENESDLESIKAYTNQRICMEGKGKNAETRSFYGNIYLTNNGISSLKGVRASDDRQFSVPEVTDIPMKNIFSQIRKIRNELTPAWLFTDKELVSSLARFLYHRDLSDYDYVSNFKSPHYYHVIKESTPEWLKILTEELYTINQNSCIPIRAVKDLVIKCGRISNLTVDKLQSKLYDYKHLIQIKRCAGMIKGKISYREHCFFSKEGEDLTSFSTRVRQHNENMTTFNYLEKPNGLE